MDSRIPEQADRVPGQADRIPGQADPVDMTRRLVRTPSVNPMLEEGGTGERAVAELAAAWLRHWGYETVVTEVAAGRCNVVSRRGEGAGPSLLLNGHLDTVGVSGMTEPFSGAVRDGRLYGRGSADMKSGVACILAVAAEMASEPIPGELIVALTADEEHASIGMEALVGTGAVADAAVVCEPTSLSVMPAHKGFLWIDAHVRGRAAHGSRPDAGVDAIAHMGHLLVAFEEEAGRLRRDTGHELLGPASLHAGTIRGGSAPSVYPDRCHLVVERRTLPGETAATVMEEVDRVVAAARRRCPGLDASVAAGLFPRGYGGAGLLTAGHRAARRVQPRGNPRRRQGNDGVGGRVLPQRERHPGRLFRSGLDRAGSHGRRVGQRVRSADVRPRACRLRAAVPDGLTRGPCYRLRLVTTIAPPGKLVP